MTATQRLPEWFKHSKKKREITRKLAKRLEADVPNSICQEAKCPNRSECFSKGILTFMILGTTCTRNCAFCSVAHGVPQPPNPNEADQILKTVETLGLKFVVLTSPNRDDLKDGGANHYAMIVNQIHAHYEKVKVEVLIPDFKGNIKDLKTVIKSKPDVINHNLETVPEKYSTVRKGSIYRRSLDLLGDIKTIDSTILSKTGLMVGLGETKDQLNRVFEDIKKKSVDILTLGQYLRPDKKSLPVEYYYHPDEFEELKQMAESHGIRYVFSGPLVRSSYLAEHVFEDLIDQEETHNVLSCNNH